MPSSSGLLISGDRRRFAGGSRRTSRAHPIRHRGQAVSARHRRRPDHRNRRTARDALRRALNQKRPGDKMVLTIFRGTRTSKVTITLGSAPEAL